MTDIIVATPPVPERPKLEKTEPPVQWELASQWLLAWRTLKVTVNAVIFLSFLMVIGQGFLFYRVFAEIHPALGWVFVAVLALLLFLLVGRPLMAFFRTPVMAKPPNVIIDAANPDPAAMKARLAYDIKYLSALAKNPALKTERAAIAADVKAGKALLARCSSAKGDDAVALAHEIAAFEATHIDARLRLIDAEVDKLIHNEAVAVGVATAISMNGTIDAFIVLWRNANLVSKVSRLYFGRPNFHGSLLILRDVAAIVVLSRALEDVTEITGDIVGSMLGRMGGLVAGPIMDGALNAMMTLKVGYLAKRRCRSFEAWTPEQADSIYASVLTRVKKESKSVISDLMKGAGGLSSSAAKAADKAGEGSRIVWGAIRDLFGRKKADEAAASNSSP